MSLEDHKNPDGTYNGLSALGEFAGIEPEVAHRIYQAVLANKRLLDACSRHDFVETSGRPGHAAAFVCSQCHGSVSAIAAHWYKKGMEHSA